MKKVIGITGGVGSGKSVVMDYMKEKYHAAIILADLVAHDLMMPGAKSYQEIVNAFGQDILDHNQEIDRAQLGNIVFQDESKLAVLNAITHPNVKEEIRNCIHKAFVDDTVKMICLEAALRLEEDYREMLDEIWFIYVNKETRMQRLAAGRGYSDEKSLSIMNKQNSDDYFRSHSERIIDNSHSVEETQEQIDKIMKMIKEELG